MMTIILSACMVADPNICKDYRLPLEGQMTSTECAMYAPPFFAQWVEEHPAWKVMRWRCKPTSENDT